MPKFLFRKAARTQKSFAAWMRPAFGDFNCDCDVDRIDALAAERAQEWTRIGAAAFLTDDEKRAAVGYGKLPRGRKDDFAAVDAGNAGLGDGSGDSAGGGSGAWVNEPRVPAGNPGGGQWTTGGGGGSGDFVAQIDDSTFPATSPIGPDKPEAVFEPAAQRQFTRNDVIDLRDHEAPEGIGHTLKDHVGKSTYDLLERIDNERFITYYGNNRTVNYATAIGTFRSNEEANTFVGDALRANMDAVNAVARGDLRQVTINHRVGSITGYESYRPGGDEPASVRPAFEVRVILWHLPNSAAGFGIRTAFPANPLPRN